MSGWALQLFSESVFLAESEEQRNSVFLKGRNTQEMLISPRYCKTADSLKAVRCLLFDPAFCCSAIRRLSVGLLIPNSLASADLVISRRMYRA